MLLEYFTTTEQLDEYLETREDVYQSLGVSWQTVIYALWWCCESTRYYSSVYDIVGRRSGYKADPTPPRSKKVPNPNLQKYIPSFEIIPPIFFPSYAQHIGGSHI